MTRRWAGWAQTGPRCPIGVQNSQNLGVDSAQGRDAELRHLLIHKGVVVRRLGLEPRTLGLKGRCSTG